MARDTRRRTSCAGPDQSARRHGAREVRRLAKEASCTEDETRLYLDLADAAGMMAWNDELGGFTPTARFDHWRGGTPAERLAILCARWWTMRSSPLRDIDGAGGRRSVLDLDDHGLSSADVRHATMRLLCELPDQAAPTGAKAKLPQPLTYLIQDVARRHGEVRVVTVACCLLADDPALLTEIAADRRLNALRAHLLAPTVLASALPPKESLAALREAGYAPVGVSADGTLLIEGTRSGRAAVPTPTNAQAIRPSVLGQPEGSATVDLPALARRLLAGPRR